MKTALALVFLVAIAAPAAGPQAAKQPHPNTLPREESQQEIKKLGSVTWDIQSHRLLWTVQKGSVVNGEFLATSEEQYEISPDEATMLFADEARGFDNAEAVSLHRLLDVLSLYCAESVVWWDQGQGVPLDPKTHTSKPAQPPARHARPDSKADPQPLKVRQPEEKAPARKYHIPENHIVAMNRW